MKIVNASQLSQIDSLDLLVKERMMEKIEILNDNYGIERKITDLGGFVSYINCKEQLDQLLEQYPVKEAEYVDVFSGDNQDCYCEVLLLAGSDYPIGPCQAKCVN